MLVARGPGGGVEVFLSYFFFSAISFVGDFAVWSDAYIFLLDD